MTKKKTFFQRRLPFFKILAGHLIWAFILAALFWLGKEHLPDLVKAYFRIDQERQFSDLLQKRLAFLKNHLSFSDPGAWLAYFSAFGSHLSALTKLNLLEAYTALAQKTVLLLFYVITFFAFLKLVTHFKNACAEKNRRHRQTQEITDALSPELDEIKKMLTEILKKR